MSENVTILKTKVIPKKDETNETLWNKFKETIIKNRTLTKFNNRWVDIMTAMGLKNYNDDTFTLRELSMSDNFKIYQADIIIPDGLNSTMLQDNIHTIEENLNCVFILKIGKRGNLNGRFIIGEVKVPVFVPYKAKPWQFYLGVGLDLKPIVFNMNDFPHIFISGITGTGKSRMVDHILTSLIANNTEYGLSLYLIQVAKDDLYIYEDCVQVRGFANTLEKTQIMLEHIVKLMDERVSIIIPLKKQGKAKNIIDYNNMNPYNKMAICIVGIDEFSSLMPDDGDEKDIKKIKRKIISCLEKIVQYGRSVGVFLLISLQRATVDNLPSFVKAMCNVRVAFRAINKKSSEVAIDDFSALNLEPREAVYDTGLDKGYVKTCDIDEQIILNYIGKYLKPNHRTIFDDLKKLEKTSEERKDKKPKKDKKNKQDDNVNSAESSSVKEDKGKGELPTDNLDIDKLQGILKKIQKQDELTYDKVDPEEAVKKQKALMDFYKKYPNAVPFNPNKKNTTIIDQTKINPSKTEKPKKYNEEVEF